MIYFLIGFMGAGKSSLGKYAAKRLNMQFIDLDQWIEETKGISISSIFQEQGEQAFRGLERWALETVCEHPFKGGLILSCGGGTPCFFDNMDYMKGRGETMYLQLSSGMLAHRLQNAKHKRPLLEAVEDLEGFIQEKLRVREPFYLQADHVITGKQLSRNAFARWLGDLKESELKTKESHKGLGK